MFCLCSIYIYVFAQSDCPWVSYVDETRQRWIYMVSARLRAARLDAGAAPRCAHFCNLGTGSSFVTGLPASCILMASFTRLMPLLIWSLDFSTSSSKMAASAWCFCASLPLCTVARTSSAWPSPPRTSRPWSSASAPQPVSA